MLSEKGQAGFFSRASASGTRCVSEKESANHQPAWNPDRCTRTACVSTWEAQCTELQLQVKGLQYEAALALESSFSPMGPMGAFFFGTPFLGSQRVDLAFIFFSLGGGS